MEFLASEDAVVPLCSKLSARQTALSHAFEATPSAHCGAAVARGTKWRILCTGILKGQHFNRVVRSQGHY